MMMRNYTHHELVLGFQNQISSEILIYFNPFLFFTFDLLCTPGGSAWVLLFTSLKDADNAKVLFIQFKSYSFSLGVITIFLPTGLCFAVISLMSITRTPVKLTAPDSDESLGD